MQRLPSSFWPLISGIALIAAGAGYGAAHWLASGATPAPQRPPVAAAPDQVKIPEAWLQSSDIAVEVVGASDVGAAILAPATVAATPGGEAVVAARASGEITRMFKRLGDSVTAGETLALVDSLDAATMAADRSVAVTRADLAAQTYAREAKLYEQGVTPRQDMEGAKAALAVAQAEARRAASVAGAAHVAGNGHSVAVVSPIAGRITAQSVTMGAFIAPQTELFHVAKANAVQVEASVAAQDAHQVKPGDKASIVLTSGDPVAAVVRSVTPSVTGSNQSATVVLTPGTATNRLLIGQGVQVRIQSRGGGSSLTVPEDAVQTIDGHDVIFVRTADGFRAQPALVGARSGGMAQILSGVSAGQKVATRHAFLLKAELKKGTGDDE